MKTIKYLFLALALFTVFGFAAATSTRAQSQITVSISGRITPTDEAHTTTSLAGVSGVLVYAVDSTCNCHTQSTYTDANGYYTLAGVLPVGYLYAVFLPNEGQYVFPNYYLVDSSYLNNYQTIFTNLDFEVVR